MTALEFIKYVRGKFPCIPGDPHKRGQPASNGQLRRWCDMGAVSINEKTSRWNDMVEFPIWEFTFFPSSKNKIRLHYSEKDKKFHEFWDSLERQYKNGTLTVIQIEEE